MALSWLTGNHYAKDLQVSYFQWRFIFLQVSPISPVFFRLQHSLMHGKSFRDVNAFVHQWKCAEHIHVLSSNVQGIGLFTKHDADRIWREANTNNNEAMVANNTAYDRLQLNRYLWMITSLCVKKSVSGGRHHKETFVIDEILFWIHRSHSSPSLIVLPPLKCEHTSTNLQRIVIDIAQLFLILSRRGVVLTGTTATKN